MKTNKPHQSKGDTKKLKQLSEEIAALKEAVESAKHQLAEQAKTIEDQNTRLINLRQRIQDLEVNQ